MTVDAAISVELGSFSLDVEVRVSDGEVLAVLGPNGSGKTTVLRSLAGLLPIDAGRITIDGVVVDEPASDRFVPPEDRSVGVVFQDYLLFSHMTALENVAFGLRARRMPKAAARARAGELLAAVDLQAFAGARPRSLSAGQAQRVALTRALATEPALLLLDEPLAALDVGTRTETRRLLRATLRDFAGARVLVTHDPVDALALADRLVIIEAGRVVQTGTPEDIVLRPRSEYAAQLAGVNLYRGHADANQVAVGDTTITVADYYAGDVVMIVPPNAVVLSLEPPAGSARNVWGGTIVAMEPLGGRVRVRVDGSLAIVAEVTPGSVAELGLAEGVRVWAAVKATEVEVYAA